MTQGNGHSPPPDRIDILIDQVGRLTEVVTTGFADLKATTERQAQVAEQQAETVRQLVGIVEALIRDRQGRQ